MRDILVHIYNVPGRGRVRNSTGRVACGCGSRRMMHQRMSGRPRTSASIEGVSAVSWGRVQCTLSSRTCVGYKRLQTCRSRSRFAALMHPFSSINVVVSNERLSRARCWPAGPLAAGPLAAAGPRAAAGWSLWPHRGRRRAACMLPTCTSAALWTAARRGWA